MSKRILRLPLGGRSASLLKTRLAAAWIKDNLNIVPSLATIRRFRSGNKISRILRHVFEHKHINKILGSNIALAVLATSIINIPVEAKGASLEFEENTIIKVDTLTFVTEKGIRNPVDNVKITQRYSAFHPGVDLDGDTGDPVRAIMAGKVESIQYSRFAYGNAVIVDHGNDITTLYAHLSKIYVQPGDEVTHNSIIGLMGSTGRSTGAHLHLEVRDQEKTINPFSLLPH